MRTDGGHVAITETSHVPVDEPDSVVKGMVCDATTAPLAAGACVATDVGAGAGGVGAGGGLYEWSVAALEEALSHPEPLPPPDDALGANAAAPAANAGSTNPGGGAGGDIVAVAAWSIPGNTSSPLAAAALAGVKSRNGFCGSFTNRSYALWFCAC